jgi:TolB-like protein/tetratricopeptide (TPR) repeat protein
MKILGELKRRNVYRIGMAYIVAAWVLLQAGYVTVAYFTAPAWVMGLVLTFLIAGFPIVLYFTWSYALTTEGIRKESDVAKYDHLVRKNGHKLDYITITLLAVIVGMVALEQYMPTPPGVEVAENTSQVASEPEPEPVIEENSIAVLPFINMSADASQDYFSDGLSEELLNVLTHVDGLKVASRTSSFAYKNDNRNIREIARALRVASILEGSVRKVGNRLRITAQLIDTSNDRHLWSDSYDRDMTDIFEIQADIANAIVAALTKELGVGLESVSVDSATSNLDAYDLYLKARELFIARTNLKTSWELLDQAVQMDPGFVRAWEALAAVRSVATSWFPGDGIDHDSLSLIAARRALELDPNLSMAYAVIGLKHQVTGEGYAGAIRNFDKAIQNNPKNSTAWLWRGITIKDMGYFDKAVSDFEQCLKIDPAYLICSQYLASALLFQGKIELAVKQFELTIEDNFHTADDSFVSYYVHSGQRKMAFLIAALALRKNSVPVKDWIEAIENPNEDHSARIERFIEWGRPHNLGICDMESVSIALRRDDCYLSVNSAGLKWEPDAAYYRKTPEFKEFVNTHLMDYWQENGFPSQCRALADGDFMCD